MKSDDSNSHHPPKDHARFNATHRDLQTQKFHALNQLAGGVAHEFNNLIAGILGTAELVGMDLPEEHPARETLKQIFEASNHARDFIHKLRDFAQRPPPDLQLIRLQPVIEECVQILRGIIPPRIELRAHLQPDCPRVHADAAQMQQAVMELCLHSWQALADRHGRITVSLELRPPFRSRPGAHAAPQTGPHVCLTVQDDSPGLERSAREHIFHPFRNRRAGGKKVGLELFLVREIVLAHHGEISVESEPGHGTAFHLFLPAAEE